MKMRVFSGKTYYCVAWGLHTKEAAQSIRKGLKSGRVVREGNKYEVYSSSLPSHTGGF